MAKRYMITDMGHSSKLKSESGETMDIPRYGVWVAAGRKPEVVDTERFGCLDGEVRIV